MLSWDQQVIASGLCQGLFCIGFYRSTFTTRHKLENPNLASLGELRIWETWNGVVRTGCIRSGRVASYDKLQANN